ncbi:MAG: histidine phosphatase family protein [Reichenbachiella sp.]|uniref:SixA phosphatase family protein n=1 Tax=Reichenbachiella sp. TaxID=2184521 RepID=UPI0032635D11
MSRELFLVRHAEANSTNFDIKDIDRPLTSDGEIDASKLGKTMSDLFGTPDLILSSTALRTRTTTAMVAEQLGYDPVNIDFLEDLYESSTRILLRVINELDDKNNKVVIVAHNPAITYLAEYVSGDVIGNVSPAGLVHLKFDGATWAEISKGNMELVKYHRPVRTEQGQ